MESDRVVYVCANQLLPLQVFNVRMCQPTSTIPSV